MHTTRWVVRLFAAGAVALLTSCSDSHLAPSPVTAVPTVPPAPNNAPVMGAFPRSVQAVATLTTVTLQATATDPDGDPLTYRWTWDERRADGSVTPQSVAGQTLSRVFDIPAGWGAIRLTLTATDSRGGTASAQVIVNVQKLTGRWVLARLVYSSRACLYFGSPEMMLTQEGTHFSGTYNTKGGCTTGGDVVTKLESGVVDEQGNFSVRVKDATWRGDMFLTGTLHQTVNGASATATYQSASGFDGLVLVPMP